MRGAVTPNPLIRLHSVVLS